MLDIQLGQPSRRDALVVFPLVAADEPELDYGLLDAQLDAGTVEITEVGEGTVPELLARNTGDVPVLVLDGEQLIGAKQNRTTNRSILLPPRSKTRIPVSCMEQGRWDVGSGAMASGPQHSPTKVRRRSREIEADYAAVGTGAPADALSHAQSTVWDAIRDTSDRLDAPSETGALNDLYTARAKELDEWAKEFPPVDEQVGLLAFLGDRPLGMDVVGGRRLYQNLHPRLLRGYLLDALEGMDDASGTLDGPVAQGFLDRVRKADRVQAPTVGLGTYRVLANGVIGAELVHERRLVHLCAFPVEDRTRGGRASAAEANRIARPSERRARRRRGG